MQLVNSELPSLTRSDRQR